MKKLTFLISATLLSATTALAGEVAGEVAGEGEKTTPTVPVTAAFESLDKNADQQISKNEAASVKSVSDAFAAADANGDGYLNKSEFAARIRS